MNYLLTAYSVIITILLIMVWFDYNNLYQRYIEEQEHSSDLRRTILKYLRGRNKESEVE